MGFRVLGFRVRGLIFSLAFKACVFFFSGFGFRAENLGPQRPSPESGV